MPVAHRLNPTTSMLAAMDSRGAVCSGAGPAGAFMDCSGASSGDTVIGLFRNHADAVAYADGMVILGLQLHTPTAEVVGPNWVVNTSPAFAGEVVAAIGGRIVQVGRLGGRHAEVDLDEFARKRLKLSVQSSCKHAARAP